MTETSKPIKGKRHFIQHQSDKGRSPEFPDCTFASPVRVGEKKIVECAHPKVDTCGMGITLCYVLHMTQANSGGVGPEKIRCPMSNEG
jgi:hypothetical protein